MTIKKEIHETYIAVDVELGSEDAICVNGKFVDEFNTLDKSFIFTLNVSATQTNGTNAQKRPSIEAKETY